MANPSDVEITLEGEEDEQGMIGGIPMGLYKKLQLAQKNRDAADAVRKEKADLAALKKKRAEDQAARIEKLKAKRATRHAEAKQEHLDHVQSVGQETRKQVKEAEAQRKLNDELHWKQARVRVEHANNLDARLDAAEAAQDQRERQEAADARALLAKRAADAKAKEDAKKAMLTDKVLKGRQKLDQSKGTFAQAKRDMTQATKAAKAEWASTSNANKEAHLENARQRAKIRAAEKADAKERADAKMRERIQAAREEKANDVVATKALNDEVQRNRMKRSKLYKARYVPAADVEHLEASDTFRRLYGLPDADGKIKSVSRPLPPQQAPPLG